MSDPYQVVRDFEQALCEYTGAPYCVTVDSCTNALYLCLVYQRLGAIGPDVVELPTHTYPGVANAAVHAGYQLQFEDVQWQQAGYYLLFPQMIFDSAKRLSKGMYSLMSEPAPFADVCLSFHNRKPLPIGRGGAILTADKHAAEWFRCARFDGRHECALSQDTLALPGWNCYMTPEQAARGLVLLSNLPDDNIAPPDPYQDLSKYAFYTEANRMKGAGDGHDAGDD